MKKIRIMLDYCAYPIWVYDEDRHLLNFKPNGFALPDELDDTETRQLCDDIQDTYEALFTNNKTEFSYKGFSNREEELIFMDKLERLLNIVMERAGDRYIIVNDIDQRWWK